MAPCCLPTSHITDETATPVILPPPGSHSGFHLRLTRHQELKLTRRFLPPSSQALARLPAPSLSPPGRLTDVMLPPISTREELANLKRNLERRSEERQRSPGHPLVFTTALPTELGSWHPTHEQRMTEMNNEHASLTRARLLHTDISTFPSTALSLVPKNSATPPLTGNLPSHVAAVARENRPETRCTAQQFPISKGEPAPVRSRHEATSTGNNLVLNILMGKDRIAEPALTTKSKSLAAELEEAESRYDIETPSPSETLVSQLTNVFARVRPMLGIAIRCKWLPRCSFVWMILALVSVSIMVGNNMAAMVWPRPPDSTTLSYAPPKLPAPTGLKILQQPPIFNFEGPVVQFLDFHSTSCACITHSLALSRVFEASTNVCPVPQQRAAQLEYYMSKANASFQGIAASALALQSLEHDFLLFQHSVLWQQAQRRHGEKLHQDEIHHPPSQRMGLLARVFGHIGLMQPTPALAQQDQERQELASLRLAATAILHGTVEHLETLQLISKEIVLLLNDASKEPNTNSRLLSNQRQEMWRGGATDEDWAALAEVRALVDGLRVYTAAKRDDLVQWIKRCRATTEALKEVVAELGGGEDGLAGEALKEVTKVMQVVRAGGNILEGL